MRIVPEKVLFILILLVLFSCSKDKKISKLVTPVYIPEDLKAYIYFQPETYWVYREINSGDEDSVIVSGSGNGIDTVYGSEGNLEGIWEWMQTNTYSCHEKYYFFYSCDASWSGPCNPDTTGICYRVYRTKGKPGDYVGQSTVLLYPPKKGKWLYNSGNSDGVIILNEIIDSLLIDGISYYKVIKMNGTDISPLFSFTAQITNTTTG